MKSKIKLQNITFLVLVLLGIGCSNEQESTEKKDLTISKLKLEDIRLTTTTNFDDTKFKECKSVNWYNTNYNIVNSIGRQMPNSYESYGFVFYSLDKISTFNIDKENLFAISQYYLKENELFHKLYLVKGKTLIEANQLYNDQVIGLVFNDVEFFIKTYLSKLTEERINVTIIQDETKENTFEKFDGLYLKKLFFKKLN